MKKVLSLLLAIVLCLGLCACDIPGVGIHPTTNSTTIPPTTAPHVHTFGEWTVSKAATCRSDGVEFRLCECGEKERRKIEATGHTYTKSVKLPTSSLPVDIFYVYTCSCGTFYTQKMEVKDHTYLKVGFCYDENYGVYCEITGVDTYRYALKFGYNVKKFVFPSEIDGYPVRSFGQHSFEGNLGAMSIVIPNGVFKIGDYAFENYSSLESITIPNTVTHIGNGAFGWCMCLKEINFTGTMAQWKAISKGNDWLWDRSTAVVKCTDGVCDPFPN